MQRRLFLGLEQPVGRGLKVDELLPHGLGIGLPDVRQLYTFGQPFKQFHLQCLFKQFDMLADGSRCKAQLVRSGCKGPVTRGSLEGAEPSHMGKASHGRVLSFLQSCRHSYWQSILYAQSNLALSRKFVCLRGPAWSALYGGTWNNG
jgi:hypothetical protein